MESSFKEAFNKTIEGTKSSYKMGTRAKEFELRRKIGKVRTPKTGGKKDTRRYDYVV